MSQADRWMGEANQRAYGYGSYADEPPRFTTIEQSMTALRQWMGQQLKEYPAVANPMNNQRIRDAMSMLEHELGRSPVKEHLPRALAESEIADMIATAKVTKQSAGSLEKAIEETQNLLYATKNTCHGQRAHDENLLDFGDATWVKGTQSGVSGVVLRHIATKNNKAQLMKKKELQCTSCCSGGLALTEEGLLIVEQFCAAHLLEHLRSLVSELLGCGTEMLKDIPVYASFRRIEKLHAGSTLVMAGDNSSADSAPILVCKVTAEEESQGSRCRNTCG